MICNNLHNICCDKNDKISKWYSDRSRELYLPIYSSYDIRDSGFKVTNVDANIYPAGFNNICPVDRESSVAIFDSYLRKHYGNSVKKILLVTEEHTNNSYYWENVATIKFLLQESGHQVLVGIPKPLAQPLTVISATGLEIQVHSAYENSDDVKNFQPDLIISNNDFSESNEEWASQVLTAMNPPRELGWYQRKKSRYFKFYNELVNEFSEIIGVDPFLMNIETQEFSNFDIGNEDSKKQLAAQVDSVINQVQKKYSDRGINEKPFVFVKNNAGTYGLAVIRVGSGQDVLEWSYKSRKKMKAAKGGRDVEEVIIQEGIPSVVQSDGASAEPVIYMIGCELAGGFLRTHAEKSATDSLNSPGAVYKKLCVTDLNVSIKGSPLENVYGWSARLGLLAIGKEAQEMGVQYKSYLKTSCGNTNS